MSAKHTLAQVLLDLSWRQWTTLGVAGMEDAGPTAIDLEVLLVLTARLSSLDPRLRDEALDWCAQSHRFISKPRLKQLVKLASDPAQAAFVPVATTLEQHVGGTWPTADQEKRWNVRLSGKSRAPDLENPALVSLKLRALFGVGARADVLAAILNWPAPDFGASDLVFVGYTKRNLAEALDTLTAGGLLKVTPVGNRLRFSWRKRRELCAVLQPLPQAIPRWPPIARIVGGFLDLLERTEGKSERLSVVAAVREFDRIGSDLKAVGLDPPRPSKAPLDWSDLVDWMLSTTRELTCGREALLSAPRRR